MNKLTVVLPVHNEAETLLHTLEEIDSALSEYVKFEFVLSEDGSVDNTVGIMTDAERKFDLRFITSKQRKGYAQAVVDAIDLVNTKYVIFMDSDGQLDPKDIKQLWANRKACDVNIGYRKYRADSIVRLIYSRCFYYFYKLLFTVPLNDPSCPLVLVRHNVAKTISNDWSKFGRRLSEGFWWEFNAWAVKRKYTFCEHRIFHQKRDGGPDTQVYKLHKMPGIIVRNILGILRVRFSKIK